MILSWREKRNKWQHLGAAEEDILKVSGIWKTCAQLVFAFGMRIWFTYAYSSNIYKLKLVFQYFTGWVYLWQVHPSSKMRIFYIVTGVTHSWEFIQYTPLMYPYLLFLNMWICMTNIPFCMWLNVFLIIKMFLENLNNISSAWSLKCLVSCDIIISHSLQLKVEIIFERRHY